MKLILLPGLDGTGELFQPLLDELPEYIETLVISYPNDRLLTYKELTDLVTSSLPQDEKFILVAESFSGPIAYNIAQKKPKNLVSIIFVATFLNNPRPFISHLLVITPFKYIYNLRAPKFLLKYIFLNPNVNLSLLTKLKKILNSIPSKIIIHRIKQIITLKKPKVQIDMSVYYILAKKDKIIPKKSLVLFKSSFNKIEVYQVNGGHLILQSFPKECGSIIVNILEREVFKC